jgi:predicted anti-sigma-YlaC factor YlaD
LSADDVEELIYLYRISAERYRKSSMRWAIVAMSCSLLSCILNIIIIILKVKGVL